MVFFRKVIAFAVTSLIYLGVHAKPCVPVTPSGSATSTPDAPTSSTPTPTSTASATASIANSGFEDPSEVDGATVWDGAPWIFSTTPSTSSATVMEQDDTTPAHSGEHYLFVSIPNLNNPTSISQTLSGLDTTHQYTLSYYWGLTTKQEIYDSRCHVQVSMDSQVLDNSRIGRNTPYEYFQYKIVFTPPSADPLLTLTFFCDSGYFYGAELLIDDITLTASTPPCTAVDPTPPGTTCGPLGRGQADDAYSFQMPDIGDSSTVQNCALSCAQTPQCETFAYAGNGQGDAGSGDGCVLFSASPDRLGFVELGYGSAYYQLECFLCGGVAP